MGDPRASLAALTGLLLALLTASAAADGTRSVGCTPARPAAYRRLFQEQAPAPSTDFDLADGLTKEEAGLIKEAAASADGQAGPFTDWVVACAPGRSRCPSLFLASWGYQCSTMDGSSCCLQPNGKFCVSMERWAGTEAPPSWQGRDNATAAAAAAIRNGSSSGEEQQGGDEGSGAVWRQSSSTQKQHQGPKDIERDSGRPWREATATFFHAYPACCTDDRADSTECSEFSGCEWAGQFAGVSGKKTPSWVRERNIVAMFEAGRSEEWSERWKSKTLRLKNPTTGSTMEVEVLDTCADDDCDGCCTSNARKNGGFLIDLEATTAERFWEGDVQGLATIQWQVV